MAVLGNFVVLEPEREKVLRFAPNSWRRIEATVPDGETREPTRKTRIELHVIEEDGKPVAKTFSTLSRKLAAQLEAMHDTGELYRYRIGITAHPQGYRTEYTIRAF